jgi:hypothetical protein
MKHDLPATVGQPLGWMRESGFTEVADTERIRAAILQHDQKVFAAIACLALISRMSA